MSYVYATLPIRVFGDIVLEGQIEIRVYPMRDDAYPKRHADDVFVRDIKDNWRTISRPYDQQILDEIERSDPKTFEEIEIAREENCSEEAA